MKKYTDLDVPASLAAYERENPSIVLTVDSDDEPMGDMEKIAAHQNGGTLHRAFSIFIFDNMGRLLLQRRASSKYHFGGLWTNSCCGHAVPGEPLAESAAIRLWQEMRVCTNLTEVRAFTYTATDKNSGLTEHEIDHVFTGLYSGEPNPNPSEVEDWRWVSMRDLDYELASSPNQFTPWFALGLDALSGSKR